MVNFRKQKSLIGVFDVAILAVVAVLAFGIGVIALGLLMDGEIEAMLIVVGSGAVSTLLLGCMYALLRIWELHLLDIATRQGVDTSNWVRR